MKKISALILTVILFSHCSLNEKEKKKELLKVIPSSPKENIDFEKLKIDTVPMEMSYSKVCQKIKTEKKISDSLSFFLEEVLVNQIFPFWYGTPWDFNGHTNIPNQGKIACGYFVSTTLKHVGFNLDRYKLAQQLPIHEAKTISLGEPIIEIECDDFKACLEKIKTKLSEGIYFVGLDASHVGFLLKRKNHLFLIHSNYGTPREVIIENVKKSPVFGSFRHFYIAKISTNSKLLNYWKTEKSIPIITK